MRKSATIKPTSTRKLKKFEQFDPKAEVAQAEVSIDIEKYNFLSDCMIKMKLNNVHLEHFISIHNVSRCEFTTIIDIFISQ